MATSILDLSSSKTAEALADSEDLVLVRALRAGAECAYETLLTRFQQPVYNLALRLLNDPSDASDVVQEVFLKVFRNIGQFRGQSTLKTWLFRITINEAHNQRRWFFRHRRREVGIEEEQEDDRGRTEVLADTAQSPFDYVFDQEKQEMVEQALARINPTFRAAVVLRDITDLSYEEVAEVLQVSLGTVKSRILRGREALRQELEKRLQSQPAMRFMPKTAERAL
ncbi:MAG TPA: sigma-70 family RNA polymerase sigma factor [Bryobacteraceae bacterium]|nr:sigma-70 family RNA polymerase sigma factor [Bryobacteraceae bacterium]